MVPSSIPASEQRLVEQLRRRLKTTGFLTQKYDTDFNLLRWLQEFDFDIEKAFLKLRFHLRFRKAWDLDNLAESNERDSFSTKCWNAFVGGGTGRENNLVVCADFMGLPDFHGLLRSASLVAVLRARTFVYERMLQAVMDQEAATGRQSAIAYILDFQGAHPTRETLRLINSEFKSLIRYFGFHYGGLFGQLFIVNAPSVMHYIWKIFKPVMPGKTAGKIQIMGHDWRHEILKWVDAAALPTIWGGNLQVPSSMYVPEKVPESYYLTNEEADRKIFKHPLLQSFPISAGKTKILTVKVPKATKLKFTLFSNGELDFGVFRTEDEADCNVDEMEMIYPQILHRAVLTHVPEEAELCCEKPGYYKFWFTSLCWFLKLKIWIVIELQE